MNEVTFHNVNKSLRKFVSGYLHARHEFTDNSRTLFSPKGTAALAIPLLVSEKNYLSYPMPTDKYRFEKHVPLLFGQMSKMGYAQYVNRFHGFVIVFTPTGLFHFAPGYSSDYTDRILYLEQIGLKALQVRLQAVFTSGDHVSQWIQAIDEILLDYFASLPQKKVRVDVSSIADEILFNKGHIKLDELIGKSDFNMRTFQTHFKRQVGITPKLFCRIARFNSLLHAIHINSNYDSLSFAIDFGYSDNSHLYKDFKDFMGMTPRQYMRAFFGVNSKIEQTLLENDARKSNQMLP
jgi:AraC-like DNA-binding protein